MAKAGSIGIDIGGTKALFALFDGDFQLVHEIKIKTERDEKREFGKQLTASVQTLVDEASTRGMKIAAVGIGCAGSINTIKGFVRSSPNIPALSRFSFKTALKKVVSAPIAIYNDVNAGLYGELKLGAAVGRKHVVGVFIGTGIGGALAIDGKLVFGASGHAGDIGHYMVQPFGPLAGSDRHGVLDDVASRTAIAGEAATLAAKRWAPYLLQTVGTDVCNIRSGALADSIRNGDKAIEELVRSRARIVGIALSNIVDFLNPDMVVIGGGLTDALPDLILEEVATGILTHATVNAAKAVKVVVAKLKSHVVTAGAAKLAFDALQ